MYTAIDSVCFFLFFSFFFFLTCQLEVILDCNSTFIVFTDLRQELAFSVSLQMIMVSINCELDLQ